MKWAPFSALHRQALHLCEDCDTQSPVSTVCARRESLLQPLCYSLESSAVCSHSSDTCSSSESIRRKDTEAKRNTERRMPHENEDRDWCNVSTSQGMPTWPATTRSWERGKEQSPWSLQKEPTLLIP
ncbi:T0030685 isoform 3 [Pongo abelii]|uniref:T0030685 isoform 3 n=1 Tax=Pongo abelii TaxID=9601 RepID=A0A2J8WN60_PONAB|nr:T0030685 isoform 3 [Pongo abelii]